MDNLSSSDAPRPILKKKSSVEIEDIEEKHHVKPILKLRKDSNIGSAFVRVSNFREESNENNIHVLLNSSNCPSENNSSVCSSVAPILKKTESVPIGSTKSSTISISRCNRSVIWRNNSSLPSDNDKNSLKHRSLDIASLSNGTSAIPPSYPSRPLSVAERIMNMESFLAAEGYSDNGSASANTTGTLPKSKVRDRDRFRTQPITAQEISKSKRYA